jgi:hypothetical protein
MIWAVAHKHEWMKILKEAVAIYFKQSSGPFDFLAP